MSGKRKCSYERCEGLAVPFVVTAFCWLGLMILQLSTRSGFLSGGFTKLVAYATKTYKPEYVIAFADRGVSDGALYKNNRFVYDKIFEPDYMYVVNKERKPKSDYRPQRFKDDPYLDWEDGLTEMELAKLNGLERIWDSGKVRYLKKDIRANNKL